MSWVESGALIFMTRSFRLACVQMNSGNDMAANIAAASDMARAARKAGAELIAFPECVSMMEMGRDRVRAKAAPEASHPALAAFRALARELNVWLLGGSLTVTTDGERVANRSVLIDEAGNVAARYDKIHMFDVDLEGGESYRESATYRPGAEARVAATPFGTLGMTVCYDLRFPQLYRALAKAGATLLAVPSAFTRPTGRAHWEVLLRARAIENGAYVFAPAQCGEHPHGRKTWGHSLIVDPWGEVLADGGEDPGFVIAEIDPARIDKARRAVPSLGHDRSWAAPEALARSEPAKRVG
jgi:predicted amidohydrolase